MKVAARVLAWQQGGLAKRIGVAKTGTL